MSIYDRMVVTSSTNQELRSWKRCRLLVARLISWDPLAHSSSVACFLLLHDDLMRATLLNKWAALLLTDSLYVTTARVIDCLSSKQGSLSLIVDRYRVVWIHWRMALLREHGARSLDASISMALFQVIWGQNSTMSAKSLQYFPTWRRSSKHTCIATSVFDSLNDFFRQFRVASEVEDDDLTCLMSAALGNLWYFLSDVQLLLLPRLRWDTLALSTSSYVDSIVLHSHSRLLIVLAQSLAGR